MRRAQGPGCRPPKSFSDQEVVSSLKLLDEDPNGHNDNYKTASPCSGHVMVGFLTHLDEDLKKHKDTDRTARSFSAQEWWTSSRSWTGTAATGSDRLLRRVRATRRAANSFLCPHQHRLASRLSYLPPAVRDRATPAAGVNALASLNPKRPAGALSPPILNSSQPPSAPPKAA